MSSERGPVGRDGAVGAEGRAGTTGMTGATGAEGAEGAEGARGATGPRGGRSALIGYFVLLTFVFIAFVAFYEEANRAKMTDRESCERVNVLRENQARVLEDQINETKRTLRTLNGLERFREQIEDSQALRAAALSRLRESVKEHPVAHRPYAISCRDAYP